MVCPSASKGMRRHLSPIEQEIVSSLGMDASAWGRPMAACGRLCRDPNIVNLPLLGYSHL